MRSYFKNVFAVNELGSRTKMIPQMLANEIAALNGMTEDKAMKAALEALKNVGIKVDEKKNQNAALFFISKKQITALAELAVAGNKDKEAYKTAIRDNPAFDIVLFGRMVADDPSLNYDAVAQVAHAISTHKAATEYDYFTAVDDEQAEDNAGAGHLGTVEFNSSTLYRYATVNLTELVRVLGADAAKVVKGFAEAFALSMPTGKQNTFANRTMPDMLYVAVRDDQPVNLAGAFESPVRAGVNGGYVKGSCEALAAYAKKVYGAFAGEPACAMACDTTGVMADLAETAPFKELLVKLENRVNDVCGGNV